jgi:hypothetical protein
MLYQCPPTAKARVLQHALHRSHKLKRHKARLLVDILALCTGLRPACFLDYAAAACPHILAQLCRSLSERLHLNLVVWQWQGMLWIVCCPVLHRRLNAILECSGAGCEVWVLDFCCTMDPKHQPPVLKPLHESLVCDPLMDMALSCHGHCTVHPIVWHSGRACSTCHSAIPCDCERTNCCCAAMSRCASG